MTQALASDASQRFHYWRVLVDGILIDLQANVQDAGPLLAHALGARAEVQAIHGPVDGAPAWTVRLDASEDYDALLASLGTRKLEPEAADLAPYWRGDFQSLRLGQSRGVQAIAHLAPFVGVTLFDPSARRLTYRFPVGTDAYLPHLEHLVTQRTAGGRLATRAGRSPCRLRTLSGEGCGDHRPETGGKDQPGHASSGARRSTAGQRHGSGARWWRPAGGFRHPAYVPHHARDRAGQRLAEHGLGGIGEGAATHAEGALLSHGKYELYEPSMDRVFQRALGLASMAVDVLIFPRFDTAVDRQALLPLPRKEGIARLLDSVRHDRPLADWLGFDLTPRTLAEAEFEVWTRTSARLPQCFELRFGRELSLAWAEIDAAFDGLGGD
ncbi:hypothetical protein ACRAWD_31845 [Caulobacter segnis]